MLIRRIQQFVDDLSQHVPLSEDDTHWLNEFKSRFLELNLDSQLSPENEAWIWSSYDLRWQKIRDTLSNDHSVNSTAVDQIWSNLAIELSFESTKIYLGDNDKTRHSVDELLDQVKIHPLISQVIALPTTVKEIGKHALSIKELFRIRNKQESFQAGEERYLTAWDYLCNKIAPSWQDEDDNAWVLYPELLELINLYQPLGDNTLFKEKLKELNCYISNLPIEEANYFYSLSFEFHGKKTYLFEVLVDCWAGADFLSDKLIETARWLNKKNPAWISTNPLVQPIYENMAIGRYFSVSKFRYLVGELDASDSLAIQEALTHLNETLLSTTQITQQIIDQLRKIYQLRWQHSIDNDKTADKDCLLAPFDAMDQSWKKLAQHLAGAGLIDSNYYRFLMPTLDQDMNLISEVPITTFPLNSYILSDDNKQLIYLPHSFMHYRSKGTFYNCNNPKNPVPLTSKEKERLVRVIPDGLNYFKPTDSKKTVSKETVEKIKQLVIDSLYIEGLSGELDSASTQSLNAEIAYTTYYYQYLKELELASPEEYANLCAHTIQLNDVCLTVQKVLENVVIDKDCVAKNGKYLLKLVLDYQPDTTFIRPSIGLSVSPYDYSLDYFVELHGLRAQSSRLIYRNTTIDHEEALRCLKTLLVFVMTHTFNYLPGTGNKIEAMGFSNWTTATGKKIFDEIWTLLESGNLKLARSIYMSILETIIESAVNDRSYKTALTRSADTWTWLLSIQSNELFKAENTIYFPLEKIFRTLLGLGLQEKNDFKRSLLIECFDELYKIEQPVSLDPTNPNDFNQFCLEVNIKLIKLLEQSKNEIIKQDVLKALRSDTEIKIIDNQDIPEAEVMARLTGPTGVGRYVSFFSKGSLPCKIPSLVKQASIDTEAVVASV